MDTLWLLYDEADLAVNLGFVDLMRDRGRVRGLNIVPVTTQELTLPALPSAFAQACQPVRERCSHASATA